MNYPVVIYKEKKFDYGGSVPDLAGFFSADTIESGGSNVARGDSSVGVAEGD